MKEFDDWTMIIPPDSCDGLARHQLACGAKSCIIAGALWGLIYVDLCWILLIWLIYVDCKSPPMETYLGKLREVVDWGWRAVQHDMVNFSGASAISTIPATNHDWWSFWISENRPNNEPFWGTVALGLPHQIFMIKMASTGEQFF